jgi:hypothetical protein
LVEQAFAALVRVAARTQTLEPDAAAADFERSPPLEAYAARVFDDARCVADWRGAARRALARDAAASGEEHDSASTDAAREIPEPLFPRLATLYASRLRETASTARDEPDAAREAADARRVCWFVLALIARSASLDAARRFREKKTERRDRRRASSDASDEAKNEKRDDFSSSKTTFAAAPSGPATPAPGDARVEALVEMARVVSAETLAPPSASSPPGDARLRRGMNLGLARLCASLTEIAGPPPGNETFSSEDDDAFSSGDEKASRDGDEKSGDGSEKSSRRWSRGGDGAFARRDGAFSSDGASRRFVARPAPDVVSRGVAVSVRVLRRRVRVAPVRRRRGGRRARHGLVPRGPRVREASGGGFRASGRRRRRARRRRRLPVLGRGRGDAAERNGDAFSKAERRARRRRRVGDVRRSALGGG